MNRDSLTWIDGITYYEDNNTATYTIEDGAQSGCDSIVTLDLKVNYTAYGTDQLTACDSLTWIDGITYYEDNNTATYTIEDGAQSGCDSIVTLDLKVNYTAYGTDQLTACDSLTWIDGITYYEDNNTATYTIEDGAQSGCDSIVTLDLKVNYTAYGTDQLTACDSLTWIDGITYYEDNNTATYTIEDGAQSGCDSIVTLDLKVNYTAYGTDQLTACDSLTWIDGITYYEDNNTATYTIEDGAQSGCDSIVTLDLKVNYTAYGTDQLTACDSLTWIDGITYYEDNNTATYTIEDGAQSGCDSIVTLDLKVNYTAYGTDQLTACDSLTWIDGITYYEDNNTATYTIEDGAQSGCDSIVTLDLKVNYTAYGTDQLTACDSLTWIDGITYYEDNNTATYTIEDGAQSGCDSIVTLDLKVNYTAYGTDQLTACDSLTWIDGITYYEDNNTATYTIEDGAQSGCDSIVTLDLKVNYTAYGTDQLTACDSLTWIDGITYYEDNNTATYTIEDGAQSGCDSIVTLDLKVNYTAYGTDQLTACDSLTWIDGITYYEDNNTATYTIEDGAQSGCDSIVTLDLKVNYTAYGTDQLTACDSLTWIDGITYYEDNNTATYTIEDGAQSGCDSIVTLDLKVNYTAYGTDQLTACDSLTWIDGITYYEDNNTATYTIEDGAQSGCDSIVTLDLKVNYTAYGTDQLTACDSLTWIDGITYYEDNNTATYTIEDGAQSGCDSIVTLDLKVNYTAYGTDQLTACDSLTWIDGITYYEDNNTATYTIEDGAQSGCDSIVTLDLKVNYTAYGTDQLTACDSLTWIDGITYYEDNNTATYTIEDGAQSGCDSIVTLDLKVNYTAYGTDQLTACDSLTWIDGITYYEDNNTATYTIEDGAQSGCDSIVTLDLKVNYTAYGTDQLTACDSLTWIDGITYYEDNNTATYTIEDGAQSGCDSIVTLDLKVNYTAYGTDQLTACDSLTWIDGITYYEDNNTATYTIEDGAQSGCDSIVTLDLKVNYTAYGTDQLTACDSLTWIDGITYYEDNNTATYTIEDGAQSGCDSIVTLDLKVNYTAYGTDQLTACDSLTWIDGITYYEDNNTATYTIEDGAQSGCDSIVTLDLKVNYTAYGTDQLTACDSLTWIDGITYYEDNNTATYTIEDGAQSGCDSIVTLDLKVNYTAYGTDQLTACDSLTWIDGITYYEDNNTATYTIEDGAQSGCDSIVTLDLKVNYTAYGTDQLTACDSLTWIDGITYYEDNNTATYTIEDGAQSGCDSIVTLDLKVNYTAYGTDQLTACDSLTWIDGITYYEDNNTATYTIEDGAQSGCDSIVTLDLKVNYTAYGTDQLTACDSLTWIDGITYYEDNNTATYTIEDGAQSGCDSIVTLDLKVNYTAYGTDQLTACDSLTWIDGITYYEDNNTATYTIEDGAQSGCDSIVTLDLKVNYTAYGTDQLTACDSLTWIDGITYYEDNNTATYTIEDGAQSGCDSIVTLDLKVNYTAYGTDQLTACDSLTWIDGITYYEDNNTATYTIEDGAQSGCDSIVTLDLKVNYTAYGTDQLTACDSLTWIDGITYYEDNNTATYTIEDGAQSGCDSIVTLDLKVNYTAYGTDQLTACDSLTWIDGITYYEDNNTATYTIEDGAQSGCDSIVTLDLKVNYTAYGTDQLTACDSLTWIDGITYYEDNNTATYTIEDGAQSGCDSIVTLDLKVNYTAYGTDQLTACDSLTWIDGITYYEDNNTATYTIEDGAQSGCDSIVTLDLKVNYTAYGTDQLTACDSLTWIDGITYYEDNNTATYTIEDGAQSGCDSIVTLDLKVNYTAYGTDQLTACDSLTWIDGITYYEDNNTATYTIEDGAQSGCDSIVTLDLKVNYTAYGTDQLTACDSLTWIDGITYYEDNNTATYTIEDGAQSGCDSIVTLDLKVNYTAYGTDQLTACDSLTWIDGITYYEDNNTATYTIEDGAQSGCDSIVTLDLKVNYTAYGTDQLTACDSLTWIDGITYYEDNNTATYTIEDGAQSGCDSIVTLDLKVNYTAYGTDQLTACDSLTWIDGITYYEDNNTATYTIEDGAQSGCDSIVTLDLKVNYTAYGTDQLTACDSLTWIDGITYYEDNNTATYTIEDGAQSGCDSIVTLDLKVNYTAYGTDQLTACDSLTWIDGITYYEDNNTATYTIEDGAQSGCDSIVTLDLKVNYTAYGTPSSMV